MTKRARRRAPMEASPSSSSFPVGNEARARYKYQCLLQDYEELLKETEEKKKKLQETRQKKLKLLGVVIFLRRKSKSLSGNPSQESLYRLRKQSHRFSSPSKRIARPLSPIVHSEVALNDRKHRATNASTSAALDLNQISQPHDEEMQELPEEWEPLRMEKMKRCSLDADGVENDLKFAVCREVGGNSNRGVKRKISWQDQLALRV